MATLVVYPSAGFVTPIDGYVRNDGVSESWGTIRDASSGETVSTTSTSFGSGFSCYADSTAGKFTQLGRGFFLFDASSIDDSATITSAVLSLYGLSKFNEWSSFDSDMHVAASNPDATNTLVSSDFNKISRTSFGSMAYSSFTISTYNDITLNSSGIAAISLTGITKFSLQFGADLNNTTPGSEANSQIRYNVRLADQTGTSEDPKLTITYEAPTPVNVTLDFISSTPTIYEPTVTGSEAVSVTLDFISNTNQIFEPTVTGAQAVNVEIDFISNNSAIYDPVVTGGQSVNVELDFVSSSSVIYEPTITIRQGVNVTLDFILSTSIIYDPTVATFTTWYELEPVYWYTKN